MLPTKIKRILLEPDPRLRTPNVDVTENWDELEPWTRLMFKAMYRTNNGVGLAAPQVGWNVRLFVMDPARFKEKQPRRFVVWNPRIIEFHGEPVPMREGCLSLPGVFGDVMRYPGIRLAGEGPYLCYPGRFEGIAAQIIQHEMDHLDGKICGEHQEPVGKVAP